MQADHKLLQHPAALCNIVRRIAIEAGHVILEYYDEAGYQGADAKGDGSPVTAADHAAEALIEKGLRDLLPGVPVVGEEAAEAGTLPDLISTDYIWYVDPLDGTKEFIRGGADFTVNIGLVHQGIPLLGVVYAPARGELYAGYGPDTALRWLEDSGKEKPINARPPPREGLCVVASAHHDLMHELENFLSSYKVARVLKMGSSLKICAVAAGKADLYPRLGPTSYWDTAAGDAVLRSAGGQLMDFQGRDLTYASNDTRFINPSFVAAGRWNPLDGVIRSSSV